MNNYKIGNTTIFEAKNLQEDFGIRNILIKDESGNHFGSIHDRRNFGLIQKAKNFGVDKLVLMTSGSNGYSLAKFAGQQQLKIVVGINKNLPANVKQSLREVCYQVIEFNLEHKIIRPEELIAFSRERDDEVIWDVTNGHEDYYDCVVDEIIHRTKPDYIVVPIGIGTTFMGIAGGIKKYGLSTKLIGIGVQNTAQSMADKLYTPWSPYLNAINILRESGHYVYNLSEDEIKKTYFKFKNLVRCEPSSSVVFAALQKHTFKPKDTVVFINTGRTQFR